MKICNSIPCLAIIGAVGFFSGCVSNDMDKKSFSADVSRITDVIAMDLAREDHKVYLREIGPAGSTHGGIPMAFGRAVAGLTAGSVGRALNGDYASKLENPEWRQHESYQGLVYNIETYVLLPANVPRGAGDIDLYPFRNVANWLPLGVDTSASFIGQYPIGNYDSPRIPLQLVHLGSGDTYPGPVGANDDYTKFSYRFSNSKLRVVVGKYNPEKAAVLILVTKADNGKVVACEKNWYFTSASVLASSIPREKSTGQLLWEFCTTSSHDWH